MLYSTVCTAILLLLLFCSITAAEREIYVSPNGSDSSNCSKESQCTLDRAFSLASGLNLTKMLVTKGNYSLKTSHSFTKIATFGLFGTGTSREDVQITCNANVSLSFTLSENITFEGVKFLKCGGWHRSSVGAKKQYPNLKGAKFMTALDFRYCRNLKISDMEISSSPGLGANLYDVGGVVNFTNSWFSENYARDKNYVRWGSATENGSLYVYSGGGVYVIFNRYGYDTVNVTPGEHDSYQHNNSYVFTNCHFLRNKAQWSNATEEHELNTPELPFNRGGGLGVYLLGSASNNTLEIKSCFFYRNNASWGGGLQVEMKDNTEDNVLVMEGTGFRENHAELAGGGARIGNLPFEDAQLRLNRYELNNCSFDNNKAIWGGGTSLYGTTIPRKCTKHTDPAVTQFYFYGCKWLRNVGNVGAAMGAFLYNENEDLIGPRIPFRVCFKNDTLFGSNEVILVAHNLTIGQGSLYSVEVPLIFKENALFINNSQSALVLDGSTLEIHDRLDFINNTGFRGGAIAMYGRSRILLNENSTLNFEANTCDDKGGALYIQAPGSPLISFNATGTNIHPCFFGYSPDRSSEDYDHWNTTVIFKDNNAHSGKSVYATTLKNCRRVGKSRQNNEVLKWSFVKYENSNNVSEFEVATDPVRIKLNKEDWQVAPGEVFDATVDFFDEAGNSVAGIVNVTIKSSSVHLIPSASSLFLAAHGKITNVSLGGKLGSLLSIELNYIGNQLLRKTVENITLKKNCYPGFTFSEKELRCKCMNSNDEGGRGVSRCDQDGKTVFVKGGYWAGVTDKFATYFCPVGYCNSRNSNQTEYKYLEGHVCNEDRDQNSVLCGNCKKNYSITIGSEQCSKSCSNWKLFYLIPIGLVLLLLVVIIMLIDLDFFTGYLNAWLYSYQVMKLLTPDGFEFDPFIEFVIAFTNIRIHFGGHSFCLAKGLDDADKLMIMYAIPTYVILVVWLLTKLLGAYPDWCFSKRVKAPFRAVCTILVLCYTDITGISLKILDPAKVGSKTFVYGNGGLQFFHGKHLWYGIVAIFYVLVFVLPFPLILLFRPFLTRGLRPVLNLNRWMPFFDAFQSCFKVQYRWCAAFYFLCRLGILLIVTYVPAGSIKRVVLEGTCILILVVFSYLRPYKEASDVREDEKSYGWINKSDVALLTTLSLITVVSSPSDSCCAATNQLKVGLTIVVKILAYVPIVVLLVLAYRVLKNYCPAVENCFPLPQDGEISPIMSETSDFQNSPGRTPETSVLQQSSRGSHTS